MNILSRWFPLRHDPARVSQDWLLEQERRSERDGWTEAPSVDWQRQTFTGPRRQPKAEAMPGRFL